jgi:NADH-quinone oxidoreductase subunit H
VWGIVWFFGKLVVFLFTFVWFRGTLPRYRYDQLMDLGWKRLIPLALGWLLLIAALRVANDNDWNRWAVVGGSLVMFLVAGSLMLAAIRTAQTRREEVNA